MTAKPIIRFTSGTTTKGAETEPVTSQAEIATETPSYGTFGISTTFVPVAADKVSLVEDHFEPTTTGVSLLFL